MYRGSEKNARDVISAHFNIIKISRMLINTCSYDLYTTPISSPGYAIELETHISL